MQVKLHHFSLLYIYNHSLLENPGTYQSPVIAKSIKAFLGIKMPVPLQLVKQSYRLQETALIKRNTGMLR